LLPLQASSVAITGSRHDQRVRRAGQLASTTDAIGNTTLSTYDASGNQLTSMDTLGFVTSYQYDGAGHVLQTTDVLGNTTSDTYDANGKKTSETALRTNFDGSGFFAVTTYQYDCWGT
jgi:YD repeat-containing protein